VNRMDCTCGRSISVMALWTAFTRGKQLKCGGCGQRIDPKSLAVDADDYTASVMAAYTQLVRYGWTSSDSIKNAVELRGNPRILGGLLAGLQRAGLIKKAGDAHEIENLSAIVDPKPIFVPGPLFPTPVLKEAGVDSGP
jgi:hypothetical protein